jgi:glycosyltransferase involved in cell wall biosynthesis
MQGIEAGEMSQKRVSVVIANYNMGKYLPHAIDSVLAQTSPVYEINVVDDGSTDDTREVAQKYKDEKRVKWHFQENQGQAKAKNKGILESSGELIAFCDADDLWTHDKIEKQLPCFDANPAVGVVHTNFALMSEDGKVLHTPKRTYYDGWISGRLLVENFVNGMASIVRRECFSDVGLLDESLPMGVDYDLWLRISARYQFYFLDEVTYLYRQWPGQMSHRHTKRFECAVKIMNKFIDDHPGLVNEDTVQEAWAHTFVGRGVNLMHSEKDRLQALKYHFKALSCKIGYLPAWKEIAKILINRT